MSRNPAWLVLMFCGLLLGLAACETIRANEKPQQTNPMWSPPNQGGNRP